jgi:nitroreductase
METWEAIRARRNVREFDNRPIARADLERILEAGRRAPSAKNIQPWDFVVVTSRSALEELSKVWVNARHVAMSAATIAIVAPVPAHEIQRDLIQYDLGQATMSMMIAAADLGIGTGHSAAMDQALARELLGFGEDRFLAYLLALGYPADGALEPVDGLDRRAFDEVVHWERW